MQHRRTCYCLLVLFLVHIVKHFIHEHTSNTCATLNYITWEQIASSCSCSRKKLQKHLQLQLNAQGDEKSNWFNTRLPCNQGGKHKDAVRPAAAVLAWKVIGLALRKGLRLCIDGDFFLQNATGALFVVIWPLVSNYELIRLKRFVSWITAKLCN
jgi:hypothetical protein